MGGVAHGSPSVPGCPQQPPGLWSPVQALLESLHHPLPQPLANLISVPSLPSAASEGAAVFRVSNQAGHRDWLSLVFSVVSIRHPGTDVASERDEIISLEAHGHVSTRLS